ncbi:unnamed protein product [Prorocentrum cordatum]|uniref:C2 domain-containing protein n=1 Tax=Prorocentrum cordatum TaxID=2364126 RepID=A0ABN9U175_9DINO|nr:unnamed protein product [Polarella glacialis]
MVASCGMPVRAAGATAGRPSKVCSRGQLTVQPVRSCAEKTLQLDQSGALVLRGRLEVSVVEAQLVRIFDSLKLNQDVFVQLLWCSSDPAVGERPIGRTGTCRQAELHPRWDNEVFLCDSVAASPGDTLKLRVQVDHVVRQPVLCGEAEFGLEALRGRAALGAAGRVAVPLFKRGERTGVLHIGVSSAPDVVLAPPRGGAETDHRGAGIELGCVDAFGDASPASTVYVSGLSEKWWNSFIERG